MRYSILTLVFLFSLAACNNDADHGEREINTEAEAVAPQPEGEAIASALPQLFSFMKTEDPAFDISKFERAQLNPMDTPPPVPLHDELQPYASLFIYNADSSYAADLYSYNTVMVKRGDKMVLQGAGPDTEIGLVDTRAKTRKRIYFGGASSAVLDASWGSPNELLVAVGENLADTAFIPRVLLFHIDSNTVQHYIYNDTLQLRSTDYLKRKHEGSH